MRLFYERYSGFLTAVCSRYVPDRADVKDILQDAFLQMFDAARRFEYRGEGSLKAWASRIAVNRALKWLRAQGRLRRVEDLPDVPEEEVGTLEKVPPAVLQGFIRELPDGYRTVFNLFVFEGMPHREIARLLGIKEDSSASQFFRARAVLAKKINLYIKEHE
ncbi:MAG: sigma-70 family RNA polymerase sigma factor [Bacteroidales bacterium]|nr:sigma-70 family RNA polymerase sigma factor [Bacteroidales bacterium]